MTLADPRGFLAAAREGKSGVGAFNVTLVEHAFAIVSAAERSAAPVVLQISENAVKYHGSLKPIAVATLAIAEAASVPVAVHLDHAEDTDLVRAAVDLGFTSVMYDGSKLDDEQNIATTARMVAYCHDAGVAVEAEIGEIGGKDGAHAPGVRTRPDEARMFAEATGVDSLAVAVGSSHAMASRDAALDLDLIRQIASSVDVPLVLHGSSGVPDDELTRAVRAGMTKINIATHLNKIFTHSVRATLEANPSLVDARKYIGPARDAMSVEVERLLTVLLAQGSAS